MGLLWLPETTPPRHGGKWEEDGGGAGASWQPQQHCWTWVGHCWACPMLPFPAAALPFPNLSETVSLSVKWVSSELIPHLSSARLGPSLESSSAGDATLQALEKMVTDVDPVLRQSHPLPSRAFSVPSGLSGLHVRESGRGKMGGRTRHQHPEGGDTQ